MKRILFCLGFSGIVLGFILGCSEDFLDAPTQGVLDSSVLGNQNGVEGTLIAAYSMLDGFGRPGGVWSAAGSNYVFGSMASDDAYKGSEPGDQGPMTDVELYQWGTGGADGYMNSKWAAVYEGVSRANATITLLNSVDDIDPADRARIEGEARFLRAHYHFDAFQVWRNIPYYTEADEDFRKANTGTDALPLIIADMQAAIGLLPESQDQVGRVTQWTAKAMLGKYQMWAQDFAGAKATLDDVVNNGPYALQDCFRDVFNVEFDNGPETVLAYQASTNDGSTTGQNGNRHERLNHPHSGSPLGCCGFHQPSQNLVNAYKVDANGLPLLDGSFNDAELTAADPVDPRLDWTVGRDDVPYIDWGLHAPGWIRDRSWAGPFSPKKHVYAQFSDAQSAVGWQNTQLHSSNRHLLRFAEVLLFLAEAEVELGNLERAREIVNQIRTRANACAQGPDGVAITTTLDDPAITWATYQVGTYDDPWTDQNIAREAVRTERRLELALEGQRFFDLRRWGVASEVLNAYLAVEETRRAYLTASEGYTSRNDLYPLPSQQIELSEVEGEQRLVQNPGW